MAKFYLALVGPNDEIEFNEVWGDEAQAKDRARVLECEAAGRAGDWHVYIGHESIEACLAREEAVKNATEDTTPDDIDAIAAAVVSAAVPGDPPVDDRVTAQTCAKCGKEYGLALDWCPACLTRQEVIHA